MSRFARVTTVDLDAALPTVADSRKIQSLGLTIHPIICRHAYPQRLTLHRREPLSAECVEVAVQFRTEMWAERSQRDKRTIVRV